MQLSKIWCSTILRIDCSVSKKFHFVFLQWGLPYLLALLWHISPRLKRLGRPNVQNVDPKSLLVCALAQEQDFTDPQGRILSMATWSCPITMSIELPSVVRPDYCRHVCSCYSWDYFTPPIYSLNVWNATCSTLQWLTETDVAIVLHTGHIQHGQKCEDAQVYSRTSLQRPPSSTTAPILWPQFQWWTTIAVWAFFQQWPSLKCGQRSTT